MNKARQEILNKLKNAVHAAPERPDFNTPVYHSIEQALEPAFKENLEKVNGSVYICSSEKELFNKLQEFLAPFKTNNVCCREKWLQDQLQQNNISFTNYSEIPESIEVGITGCEFLIAHTGSAMVSSAQEGGRQLFVYPPVHVIIASKNQVVDYLDKAYSGMQERYKKILPSQITLVTGPSRTADIEKTLILGAHGPKELHVFIR